VATVNGKSAGPEEKIHRRNGFDDLTALVAIRALTKAGVKVPEQCSVTGFDDVALSSLAAPSLTTVRQPMEAMGGLAVNIVMRESTLRWKSAIGMCQSENESGVGDPRFNASRFAGWRGRLKIFTRWI